MAATAPAAPPPLSLDLPWVKATVDGLVLALSADGVIDPAERETLVGDVARLLERSSDAGFRAGLEAHLQRTLAEIERAGRPAFLRGIPPALPSPEQRRAALFLAAVMVCADGTLAPAEAAFLAEYRAALGFSEAEALLALSEAQRFVGLKLS